MHKDKFQQGFTLVEVMVATVILVLIMTAVLDIYLHSVVNWQKDNDRIDVQQNMRSALDQMSRELQDAQSLSASSTGTSVSFINNSNQTISYYLNVAQQQIQRDVNGTGHNVVAGDITGLTFTYGPDPQSPDKCWQVTIDITGTTGYHQVLTMETTVAVRAVAANQ